MDFTGNAIILFLLFNLFNKLLLIFLFVSYIEVQYYRNMNFYAT